ncbi:hypothetical protein Ae201684P_014479 [Aphanomyces euteiches]|nr:hypothetical protein Ae201684P_014479 [Aphanomyces euteiches]
MEVTPLEIEPIVPPASSQLSSNMEVDPKSTKRTTSQSVDEDGFVVPRSKKRVAAAQASPTFVSWASTTSSMPSQPSKQLLRQWTLNMKHQLVSRDAFVKRQHVADNKLCWHPDNLTMEELVQVLQAVSKKELLPTPQSSKHHGHLPERNLMLLITSVDATLTDSGKLSILTRKA